MQSIADLLHFGVHNSRVLPPSVRIILGTKSANAQDFYGQDHIVYFR